MDALSVTPVGPATLSALSALRPVLPLAVPATTNDGTPGSAALSIQDLAQGVFQRTLQAATLSAVTDPTVGSAGLALQASASLLASLNAPQAAADTTPLPGATTNPAQATTTASTAPSATPPTAAPGDLPATQDAFATSSSADFALQTALRFGAGVSGPSTPTQATSDLGAGLVRDAATVQRLGSLQPHEGGPGPEAFTRPQAANARLLRTYETPGVLTGNPDSSRVDLFA